MAILKRIDRGQRRQDEEIRLQIETDYLNWLVFFEEAKKNFQALWDFFAVIEADAHGWFRFSPLPSGGFMSLTSEGYNFGAGIELNFKPSAPFPRKWMLVTLGYSQGGTVGIGDERLVGRTGEMNDVAVGLDNCHGKDLKAKKTGARELKERSKRFPLIFQMYSEQVGQKAVKVPASILEDKSLVNLCQGLFVALNKDLLDDITEQLPGAERVELDWQR